MKKTTHLTVRYHDRIVGRPPGKYVWHLAPAYDLTRCTEGYNGEHATSVNGTGNPTLADMIAIGVKNKMKEQRCREIFDEVYSTCGDLLLRHIPGRKCQ